MSTSRDGRLHVEAPSGRKIQALYKHIPMRDPDSQVRLLRFHANETKDVIRYSLERCDVEKAPPYRAISYMRVFITLMSIGRQRNLLMLML